METQQHLPGGSSSQLEPVTVIQGGAPRKPLLDDLCAEVICSLWKLNKLDDTKNTLLPSSHADEKASGPMVTHTRS